MEYVSGFSDLSPLQNLQKVFSFEGLQGIKTLRNLHISGTLDWKQPIENFTFLEALPALEILSLMSFLLKTPFPAFKPLVRL